MLFRYDTFGYDKESYDREDSNKNVDTHHKFSEKPQKNKSFSDTEIAGIKIGLASPEIIREWSYGEVKKPETINPRTFKPEPDGLFCEKIFGPVWDWECHCGKYKKIHFKGKVCERCGVEITSASVRRQRMGHIELAAPVSHIWYLKGVPSRMGLLLDILYRDLEKVLYFAKYIVIDPGDTPLVKKQLLSEKEYGEIKERYDGDPKLKIGIGAEAIRELLSEIDVDELCAELRKKLKATEGIKKDRLLKRLEAAEAFRNSGNRPEWMILNVIPVIPPDIRPMVQHNDDSFSTSDLNELYKIVINRNNRVKRLLELGAPNIIVNNEKRMLQEAVDALIDNGRHGRPVTDPNNRALKSLSDMLKGNQGRFRQNLLGKCVDYSGCSVVVPDNGLKLSQCGLPKEMALELFKPFVMKWLCELGSANNLKAAKILVEKVINKQQDCPAVWDALEDVVKNHPVILTNTDPLTRLRMQAFEPILIEDKAIRVHPLLYKALNDDQIAVHIPLSAKAQYEARSLMLASSNLLKPSDGTFATEATPEMLLGACYLTLVKPEEIGNGKVFRNVDEAIMAYDEGDLSLHAPIKLRMTKEVDGKAYTKLLECTLGRVIFNESIPQDLGFVDRDSFENMFKPEIDEPVSKEIINKIIEQCVRVHGNKKASEVLENMTAQCLRYATRSGISFSASYGAINQNEIISLASNIDSDYPEGLKPFEYFSSAHSVRRELFDKTADITDTAYLTRRLINVAHNVIITQEDCQCSSGLEAYDIKNGNDIIESLSERLEGRYLTESLCDDLTGEIICDTDTMIDHKLARKIADMVNARPNESDRKIRIRSPLTCECERGVCAKCYGSDLTSHQQVEFGEAIGIIAAQSLGESGSRLTKRFFLYNTETLPRIEELFEARSPRTRAILSEISGRASFERIKDSTYIVITNNEEVKKHLIPSDAIPCQDIQEGTYIRKGQPLTEGALDPHNALALLGVDAVHSYLINEVQKAYRMQGIDINDKHIEIIVRQMMRRLKLEASGSTKLIEGTLITPPALLRANAEARALCEKEGIPFRPAVAAPWLQGITKATLTEDSFLSAATFQEANKVLTDAAIKGKLDPLLGLKENIIIGRLIPAGTGMADASAS